MRSPKGKLAKGPGRWECHMGLCCWLTLRMLWLPCVHAGVHQGATEWLLRGLGLHSSQHPGLLAIHLPHRCGVHGERAKRCVCMGRGAA